MSDKGTGQESLRAKSGRLTAGKVIGRMVLVLVVFLAITAAGAYATLWTICKGPSPAASNLFVSTILETGQMKFLASWFFSEDEILEITSLNGMKPSDEQVDPGLIDTSSVGTDGDAGDDGGETAADPDGIEIIEISGRSFFAKLMIVNDPARVKLTTIYPWSDMDRSKKGKTLEQLVTDGDYLAGINGGLYYSDGNWGGRPQGIVVCDGELQYNDPHSGDVLIGFNEDNILIILDVGDMTAAQAEKAVEENRIRDAVCFKDVEGGDDNHFAKLIINGKAREITGTGSGANPRTAIGQREDGAVLLLVTDGRGASGHLGATAQDLISIMLDYGAVNAANLDGGSSSSMYYDGAYEMTSVTLYYSTSSWRLPTAFVVEKREGEA